MKAMSRQQRVAQDVQVLLVAAHRNGISGEPFHVVRFTFADQGEERRRNMVATVFAGRGTIAVLDADAAAAGDIGFGSNSWRGDDFEPILRQAIRKFEGQS